MIVQVDIPDGYEDATYLAVVREEEGGQMPYFYVTVLESQAGEWREVEEVGGGTALRGLLIDAARVIRTGTAVVTK